MLNAKTVANLILRLAREARECGEDVPQITPMSIQKLVYIAHGYYLAATNQPLIAEPVEAWPWGPVIESLYHEFKEFWNREITREADVYPEPVSTKEASLVAAVWNAYRTFTPAQLFTMTYRPNTPWSEVSRRYRGVPYRAVIPNDSIRAHYRSQLDRKRARLESVPTEARS